MSKQRQTTDPWSDALSPKIKPEAVPKTWRKDTDPIRRRATFGVAYPRWEIAFSKSDDVQAKLPLRPEKTKRRSVQGVRFHFLVPNLTLSETEFIECKFHRLDTNEESRISSATFKNCTFKRCIMGGTLFRQTVFEECSFIRSDFGGSQFIECQFIDCNFTECTAENASFSASEVDPPSILAGLTPPTYNYGGLLPAREVSETQITHEWIEVRRRIAAQILRSNLEIHNTLYADRGLFELKKAELLTRVESLRKAPFKGGIGVFLFRVMSIFINEFVLTATRGGTSLLRLFGAASVIVPLYAVLLSKSHVAFMNQDCHLNSPAVWPILQQMARATSLFLAVGYTAFSGGAKETVLLTLGAAVGLLWYSLVAAVIVHRVYR